MPRESASKPKEEKDYKNLPWTEEMMVSLLKLVIEKGVHLASGKQATEKWESLCKDFFEQDVNVKFKDSHFKLNEATKKPAFRKLQVYFVSLHTSRSIMSRIVAFYRINTKMY